MTADAFFGFFLVASCCCCFLNKYAAFSGDQPVGQLCSSAMRTLAAEESVFLVGYSVASDGVHLQPLTHSS